MSRPTCTEIANDFELWGDYVDPGATMTKDDFDDIWPKDRLATIHELYPQDCNCAEAPVHAQEQLDAAYR